MTWYWYATGYAAFAILLALIFAAALRERSRIQQEAERYRKQLRTTRQLTDAIEAGLYLRQIPR